MVIQVRGYMELSWLKERSFQKQEEDGWVYDNAEEILLLVQVKVCLVWQSRYAEHDFGNFILRVTQ